MGKEGIEFFPLQCQLDEKFELIEAEFGLKGFAIIIKLLQRIYREHGYYCEWNSDIALLFAWQNGVSRKQGMPCAEDRNHMVSGVVNSAVRRGIFNRELYEKFGILTSRGIQKRYLDIVYKRKVVKMEKAYLLLSAREIKGNVVILDDSDDRNGKNDDRNGQSKGKESNNKISKEIFVANDETSATMPEASRYVDGCFEIRCVDMLIKSVLQQMPGARVPKSLKDREKWADEIEKMKRLDKRTESDIWEALTYALTDDFWRANIRSTKKFREKFETLFLQSRRKGKQKQSTNRFHNLEEHGYDYDKIVWSMMGRDGGENERSRTGDNVGGAGTDGR